MAGYRVSEPETHRRIEAEVSDTSRRGAAEGVRRFHVHPPLDIGLPAWPYGAVLFRRIVCGPLGGLRGGNRLEEHLPSR